MLIIGHSWEGGKEIALPVGNMGQQTLWGFLGRSTPRRPRIVAGVLAIALALGAGVPTGALAQPPLAVRTSIDGVVARRVSFDPTLQHNIADLDVVENGQTYQANFLSTYLATGGATRWGYPTSEPFQEEPGNIAQYFQRGVLDWHWRDDLGSYVVERRLAWDYVGGDRAGDGRDQGVEPAPANAIDPIGPWGHTVSDTLADGTPIGFAQFFQKYGGVDSFGYPKSEARLDDGSGLSIPGATPGLVRQYFQAAVFEYHPEDPTAPVQLRLLGDDLRDKLYPGGSWRAIPAFRPATADIAGKSTPSLPVLAPATAPAQLRLDPVQVQQGRSVAVRVTAPAGANLRGLVDGRHAFELAPVSGGAWGLAGIDAWASPGPHTISVTSVSADGSETPVAQGTVQVVPTPSTWIEDFPLPASKGDITQPNVQAAENRQLAPIFSAFTPRQLWQGAFLRPVPGTVTQTFGDKYSRDGGKTFYSYHEGLDIGAWTGTPVLAANSGRVVVARSLHVRGNGVIIDHGMGVFSGYYHMSRIVAREGSDVQKGDLIGYVGETGFATGPHLHWEIRLDNQYVDPTEWLSRDVEP